MRQQSYLDIYPSTGIAKTLSTDDLEKPESLKQLVLAIEEYIQIVEIENVKFLQARKAGEISSAETFKFFRSQERSRNTRLILQYLVAFLDKLPLKDDFEEKMINPFLQMKTFTRNNINLLKDADVGEAILKEHEKLGLLQESNAWYYRGQISKNHKQILKVIESARLPIPRHYCALFEALNRLCLFWFSVRNENIKRVRRSDIFIYKLTLILLNRHFEAPVPSDP